MSMTPDLEPTTRDFQIGDTVRVTNPSLGAYRRVGEIIEVLHEDSSAVGTLLKTEFSFGHMRLYPYELELVAPEPIPEPTPDLVAHPPHYSLGTPPGIEVIDIIRAHMAAGGTWETANALKYILRHPFKGNPKQDIAKAGQYLSMWADEQNR